MAELNTSVPVAASAADLTEDFLGQFQARTLFPFFLLLRNKYIFFIKLRNKYKISGKERCPVSASAADLTKDFLGQFQASALFPVFI